MFSDSKHVIFCVLERFTTTASFIYRFESSFRYCPSDYVRQSLTWDAKCALFSNIFSFSGLEHDFRVISHLHWKRVFEHSILGQKIIGNFI